MHSAIITNIQHPCVLQTNSHALGMLVSTLFKFVALLLIPSLASLTVYAQNYSQVASPNLTLKGDDLGICANVLMSPIGIEGTNLTLGIQEDKLSWVNNQTEQLFSFSLTGVFGSVYFH